MVDPEISQKINQQIRETQRKINDIDGLVSQCNAIKNEIGDVSSAFAKISKYLEKVIINGEVYDKGEFKNNSTQLDDYKSSFDNIRSELIKIQDKLKGDLRSYNSRLADASSDVAITNVSGNLTPINKSKVNRTLE